MAEWEIGVFVVIVILGMYAIYDALRSVMKQLAIISGQLESLIKLKRDPAPWENETN